MAEGETNELSTITGKTLVLMKSYCEKLCRKGLLERGLRNGILIGEFREIEKEYMKKMAKCESDHGILLTEMMNEKAATVNKELSMLIKTIKNLDISIGNVRMEAVKVFARPIFEKWTKHVDEQLKKFSEMYSKSNEWLYKYAETTTKGMSNVFFNVNEFKTGTSIPYGKEKESQRKKNDKEMERMAGITKDDLITEDELKWLFAEDVEREKSNDDEDRTEKRMNEENDVKPKKKKSRWSD